MILLRATACGLPIISTISPIRGKNRRPCCCCTRQWEVRGATTLGSRRSAAIIGSSEWICAATANLEIPPPEHPLTLDRLVTDVTELMDHLGVRSAHIVGNSAGGYLGQQLAMKHGDRVRSLMLFGSTPGLKNSQAPSWIPQIAAKGLRGFLAETIAERLPLDQVEPGLVEWFLDEAAKNDPAYIGKFVLLMASYDWSDEVGHIRCPTLVVVPGAEQIGSTANYEPFRRLVPDVEMRVYDGAPHNICDAFPERCAADVRDFLSRRFGIGN